MQLKHVLLLFAFLPLFAMGQIHKPDSVKGVPAIPTTPGSIYVNGNSALNMQLGALINGKWVRYVLDNNLYNALNDPISGTGNYYVPLYNPATGNYGFNNQFSYNGTTATFTMLQPFILGSSVTLPTIGNGLRAYPLAVTSAGKVIRDTITQLTPASLTPYKLISDTLPQHGYVPQWQLKNIFGGISPLTAYSEVVTNSTGGLSAIGKILHTPVKYETTDTLRSSIYNNGTAGLGATLTATVNGILTIDSIFHVSSIAPLVGDRLLIKNEINQTHNGIYQVTSTGTPTSKWVLTRTNYASVPLNMAAGSIVEVQSGISIAVLDIQRQITTGTIVFGTTPLVFQSIYSTSIPINISKPDKNDQFVQIVNTIDGYTFGQTLDQTFVNTDGRTDNVMRMGTNIGVGGIPLNTSDNSNLYWSLENHYLQPDAQFEWHWQSYATDGTTRRQLQMNVKKADGSTIFNWAGENHNFTTTNATPRQWGNFLVNKTTGSWSVQFNNPATIGTSSGIKLLGNGTDGNTSISGITGSTILQFLNWPRILMGASSGATAATLDMSSSSTSLSYGSSSTYSGSVMSGGAITWLAANNVMMRLSSAGKLLVGANVNATAWIQPAAGTAAAGTSPWKYTAGALMTTPEALAKEALTDKEYFTITTGAARKEVALNDVALNSGIVPVTTTNGRLTNTTTTVTQLGYLNNVTGDIQGQLNSKGSGTLTGLTSANIDLGVSGTTAPILTFNRGITGLTNYLDNTSTANTKPGTLSLTGAAGHLLLGTSTDNGTGAVLQTAGTVDLGQTYLTGSLNLQKNQITSTDQSNTYTWTLNTPTQTANLANITPSRSGQLAVEGANFNTVQSVNANYATSLTDYFIAVDASAGAVTITLKNGSGIYYNNGSFNVGITNIVKKIDSSVNSVTVVVAGSGTIDGASSAVLAVQNASITLQANSTTSYLKQ